MSAQHAGGIAEAGTIERQVDHLASDVGCTASVLVLEEKDPPFTAIVLTPRVLGPIGLFARLDDLRALTVGTLHGNVDHLCLLAMLSCGAILQGNY
jgi:hypothetical protein